MSKGYIYILSNPAMPEMLKVGYSKTGGARRAKELNTTGVPSPFELIFEIYTDNARLTERAIHKRLERFRVNYRREFFDVDEMEAIEAVMDECSKNYELRAVEPDIDEAISAISALADKVKCSPVELYYALKYIDPTEMKAAYEKLNAEIAASMKKGRNHG